MKLVRDIVLTLVVLAIILLMTVALPFIALLLFAGGGAYIIYAIIHDQRVKQEQEEIDARSKRNQKRQG